VDEIKQQLENKELELYNLKREKLELEKLKPELELAQKIFDSHQTKLKYSVQLSKIGTGLSLIGVVLSIAGHPIEGLYFVLVSACGLPLAKRQHRSAVKEWKKYQKQWLRVENILRTHHTGN